MRELEGLPVLIVENDPASAKLAAVAVGGDGCETRVAYSAEEALDVLRDFRPRVLIVDIVLPLMSGLLLAQQVKSDPRTRDIVCIAVSAFTGPAAERAALR